MLGFGDSPPGRAPRFIKQYLVDESSMLSAKHLGSFGDKRTSAKLRRGIGDYFGILGDVSGIVRP